MSHNHPKLVSEPFRAPVNELWILINTYSNFFMTCNASIINDLRSIFCIYRMFQRAFHSIKSSLSQCIRLTGTNFRQLTAWPEALHADRSVTPLSLRLSPGRAETTVRRVQSKSLRKRACIECCAWHPAGNFATTLPLETIVHTCHV